MADFKTTINAMKKSLYTDDDLWKINRDALYKLISELKKYKSKLTGERKATIDNIKKATTALESDPENKSLSDDIKKLKSRPEILEYDNVSDNVKRMNQIIVESEKARRYLDYAESMANQLSVRAGGKDKIQKVFDAIEKLKKQTTPMSNEQRKLLEHNLSMIEKSINESEKIESRTEEKEIATAVQLESARNERKNKLVVDANIAIGLLNKNNPEEARAISNALQQLSTKPTDDELNLLEEAVGKYQPLIDGASKEQKKAATLSAFENLTERQKLIAVMSAKKGDDILSVKDADKLKLIEEVGQKAGLTKKQIDSIKDNAVNDEYTSDKILDSIDKAKYNNDKFNQSGLPEDIKDDVVMQITAMPELSDKIIQQLKVVSEKSPKALKREVAMLSEVAKYKDELNKLNATKPKTQAQQRALDSKIKAVSLKLKKSQKNFNIGGEDITKREEELKKLESEVESAKSESKRLKGLSRQLSSKKFKEYMSKVRKHNDYVKELRDKVNATKNDIYERKQKALKARGLTNVEPEEVAIPADLSKYESERIVSTDMASNIKEFVKDELAAQYVIDALAVANKFADTKFDSAEEKQQASEEALNKIAEFSKLASARDKSQAVKDSIKDAVAIVNKVIEPTETIEPQRSEEAIVQQDAVEPVEQNVAKAETEPKPEMQEPEKQDVEDVASSDAYKNNLLKARTTAIRKVKELDIDELSKSQISLALLDAQDSDEITRQLARAIELSRQTKPELAPAVDIKSIDDQISEYEKQIQEIAMKPDFVKDEDKQKLSEIEKNIEKLKAQKQEMLSSKQ